MNKEMLNRIARYCATSGSQNTADGRWSISYNELSHHFGVDKNDINGNAQLLSDALNQQEEINDLMMTEDCIEMTYHITIYMDFQQILTLYLKNCIKSSYISIQLNGRLTVNKRRSNLTSAFTRIIPP